MQINSFPSNAFRSLLLGVTYLNLKSLVPHLQVSLLKRLQVLSPIYDSVQCARNSEISHKKNRNLLLEFACFLNVFFTDYSDSSYSVLRSGL